MAETFGLFLVQRGVVTREALYEALRHQRAGGGLLGTCLLDLGRVRRGPLLQALAVHLGRPPAPPSRVLRPDPALAPLYDAALLRRLRAVPYAYGRKSIHIAFADPRFVPALEALKGPQADDRIHLKLAVEPDVAEGLDSLFGPAPEATSAAAQATHRPPRVIAPPTGDGTGAEALGLGVGVTDRVPVSPRPRPAPATAGRPLPVPAAGAPVPVAPAAAPAPAPAEPPRSFGNEEEVAFARATGFDREQTAIFRLDDLAAQHEKTDPDEGGAAPPAAADEGAEEILPPANAPRLAEAAESLFEAANEGVLARRLVGYFAAYFPRVLLLARHGDTLRGILARGLERSGPEVVGIRVPSAPFARLFADGIGYYGPPPGGQDLEPLYDALGAVGVNAFVLPIETQRDAPWMLYADHADHLGRYGDVHDLEMMAKEAATALDMLRGV